MKKLWWVGVILVALLAVVGLASCSGSSSPGLVSGILSSQQEGIWVNGEGKVTVTPDVVEINLGVESQEITVAAAQAQASQAMDQVMKVLRSNNIADKDIQTQQYTISPVYQYDDVNKKNNIIGYQVTNIVNVKIRETANAGAIIDAVAAAGGDLTRINSISFSVDDPTQYYDEARAKAMTDAGDKAKQLASLSGVTLGKPTYISEYTSTPTPIYAKDAMAAGASVSTSISTGSTDITVSVQVTYAILK